MSLLEWLKIWSKFYRIPLFWNTEYPPPLPTKKLKLSEILALWLFSFRIPPPPKLKFRQILALCDFSVSEYPLPSKKNWNLGRSWHFVTFQFQNTPPPPENWNLGRSWHFVTFQFQNTPPPRKIEIKADLRTLWLFSFRIPPPLQKKLKFRQILALCDFSVSEYPTPPNWNLGRSWHFVTFLFQNTPPKLKFRQILALCDFSVSEYPPPPENWNLGRFWHFVTFQFQNTPSPPKKIEI